MAKATYLADDPSQPYFPQSPIPTTARWTDSLNWKWDPATWTGDTWLPAGAVVTIKRHVTYAGCVGGGFAAGVDTYRGYGMAIEIARPGTRTSATAATSFKLPGLAPDAPKCESTLYYTQASNNATTAGSYQLGWFDWPNGTTWRLESIDPGGKTWTPQAIAVSRQVPEMLYCNSRNTGENWFNWYNTSTNQWGTPTQTTWLTDSLGFDPQGNLWSVASGTGTLYKRTYDPVTKTLGAWEQRGNLRGLSLRPSGGVYTWQDVALSSVVDLAFDGEGNLWVVDSRELWKVDAAALSGAPTTTVTATYKTLVAAPPVGSTYYGMAFDADGSILLSNFGLNAADANIYAVHPDRLVAPGLVNSTTRTTTTPTLRRDAAFSGRGTLGDLANCIYPNFEPAFQVKKAVINEDGSVSPVGTTGQTVRVNSDGTVTVDYLVSVTNISAAAGRHPAIVDSVSLPSGFTVQGVRLNGVTQTLGAQNQFTIPADTVDLPANGGVRVYTVSVTGRAADMAAVNWTQAGTCTTTGAGTPSAGGFFNLVTMVKDQDGPDNNDACVPVIPPTSGTAQLTLVKRIVDASGAVISSKAADSQYFTLIAAGPTKLQGSSTTSGATNVTGAVMPGTYRLTEVPNTSPAANNQGQITGGYTFGTWSCNAGKVPDANRDIALVAGDNVTCTITNVPVPPFHVVKTATTPAPASQNTPAAANPHIGTIVSPDANGILLFNYTITVTNDGSFVGDSGPVLEWFQVPDGLVWAGGRTASITYRPGATGAGAAGFVPGAAYTESALANGLVLANAIQRLPAGASVSFDVTIPLTMDTTVAAGQTRTNYQIHAQDLATCSNPVSAGGNRFTNGAFGVANVTSISEENQSYSDIPTEDNVACIPVSSGTWSVGKQAPSAYAANGSVATWAPEGSTGTRVDVNADGTVRITYRVRVTNEGTMAGDHPTVADRVTVPSGFAITAVTLDGVPQGTSGAFTIPTAALAAGATRYYTVVVDAVAANLQAVDWTRAGQCETSGGGNAGVGGFFNVVTMTGLGWDRQR